MAKKARRKSTAQAFEGMTIAEFHHNYIRPDRSTASDYAIMRNSFYGVAKPEPAGMVRMCLSRNQRRLAKKLGIELREAK